MSSSESSSIGWFSTLNLISAIHVFSSILPDASSALGYTAKLLLLYSSLFELMLVNEFSSRRWIHLLMHL